MIEQVLSHLAQADRRAEAFFFRTSDQHEVALVRAPRPLMPSEGRHLVQRCLDPGDRLKRAPDEDTGLAIVLGG